jgi:hypothetical protein
VGEAGLASARAVVELHSPGVVEGIEFQRIGQDDRVLHGRNGGGTAMLNSRRMAAAITLAVLGLSFSLMGSPGQTARAAGPTTCTFEADYTISPGLSTSPSSGSITTNGETGTMTCNGPVNGKQPTGPGTIGVTGHYGTKGGETCQSGGRGDYAVSYTIPTSGGPQHVTDTGTFTYGGIQGGLFTGQFQGSRMSGTFQVRPTQGDCLTAPMTKAHQSAKSTLY